MLGKYLQGPRLEWVIRSIIIAVPVLEHFQHHLVAVPADEEMIILDEEPSSKAGSYSNVAGPTLRFPDRAAGRSTMTLPDYETSQALAYHEVGYKKPMNQKADRRYVLRSCEACACED
jgi:hypothetical protein